MCYFVYCVNVVRLADQGCCLIIWMWTQRVRFALHVISRRVHWGCEPVSSSHQSFYSREGPLAQSQDVAKRRHPKQAQQTLVCTRKQANESRLF